MTLHQRLAIFLIRQMVLRGDLPGKGLPYLLLSVRQCRGKCKTTPVILDHEDWAYLAILRLTPGCLARNRDPIQHVSGAGLDRLTANALESINDGIISRSFGSNCRDVAIHIDVVSRRKSSNISGIQNFSNSGGGNNCKFRHFLEHIFARSSEGIHIVSTDANARTSGPGAISQKAM